MTDIEGSAEEIGSELIPMPETHPPTTLFRTDDPVEVVQQASRVADALKGVITSRKLATSIQGRDHVRVEGWTTLGSMLGVVPVVEWSRPVASTERRFIRREKVDRAWKQVERKGSDWEARVTARTLDGRVIGAAEATCSREEQTWAERDDYALRSMAQTRATSKALRGPLGFVVTLAGYDATPAEEMPHDTTSVSHGQSQPQGASEPQLRYVKTLVKRNKVTTRELRALMRAAGLEVADDANPAALLPSLTGHQASKIIETLKDGPVPTGGSDVPASADDFKAGPVEGGGVPWDGDPGKPDAPETPELFTEEGSG